MGQIEVYEWLKEKRLGGEDRFFTVNEVKRGLRDKGFTNGVLESVRGALIRLECSGYLDIKMSGKLSNWKRMFKVKDKYVVERK